jgi:hypothetical protein
MGSGTATGLPDPAAEPWFTDVAVAVSFIAKSFGLNPTTLLAPLPAQPPAGSEDPGAVWVVPVSYFSVFDEFRASSTDRASLLRGRTLANVLSDADASKLASVEFLWKNCLDVLLWWADTAQTRNATVMILETITAADQLATQAAGPGGTVRRIMVSHSLGTAATTFALRALAQQPVWRTRAAFDAWFTLANVAPFLLGLGDVYAPPLIPDRFIGSMYVARNECDPVPWLLPWRAFAPDRAGPFSGAWQAAADLSLYRLLQTAGVVATPRMKPDIGGVHGFSNYLLSPLVAARLAGFMRGQMFTPAEQQALKTDEAFATLPALACSREPLALRLLKDDVAQFIAKCARPEDIPGKAETAWIGRLLRAAELLLAAQGKC